MLCFVKLTLFLLISALGFVFMFPIFHCSLIMFLDIRVLTTNILLRKMSIFICLLPIKNFFNWFHRDLEKICLWSKLGCAPFAVCSVLARRPLLERGLCWRAGNGNSIGIWKDHNAKVLNLIDRDVRWWNVGSYSSSGGWISSSYTQVLCCGRCCLLSLQ